MLLDKERVIARARGTGRVLVAQPSLFFLLDALVALPAAEQLPPPIIQRPAHSALRNAPQFHFKSR
jgi:hypothetical protein